MAARRRWKKWWNYCGCLLICCFTKKCWKKCRVLTDASEGRDHFMFMPRFRFFISFQKPPLKSQLILFISKYKYIRTKLHKWLLKTQIFWKGKFHTSKLVGTQCSTFIPGCKRTTSPAGHMKVTFKHAKLPARPFERVSFPTPTKRSPSSGNIQDLGIEP